VAARGGLGCDPGATVAFAPAHGRWAAVAGGARVLEHGPDDFLALTVRAGAALLVIADDLPSRGDLIEARLARGGTRAVRVDPADVLACEEAMARAAETPGAPVLAIAPCTRDRARLPPVRVSRARCNRCGACLSLACPALSDRGDDAMVVDPRACSGCGRCLPLCRGRALEIS